MPTFRCYDPLSAEELDIIQDEITNMITDPQVGSVFVTYRRSTLSASATYNPATGAITDPYSSKTVSALLGAVKEADAKMAGVDLEASDLKMLVSKNSLDAAPKSGDIVVHSGTTYQVVKAHYQIHTGLVVCYLKIQGGRVTS